MNEAKLMEIVVESLLFAAEPSFAMGDEREESDYTEVLHALKASNPDVFQEMDLTNISLFYDESAAESALVNNIREMLGDKLTIVDARD